MRSFWIGSHNESFVGLLTKSKTINIYFVSWNKVEIKYNWMKKATEVLIKTKMEIKNKAK